MPMSQLFNALDLAAPSEKLLERFGHRLAAFPAAPGIRNARLLGPVVQRPEAVQHAPAQHVREANR